jgi:hypothetical protein
MNVQSWLSLNVTAISPGRRSDCPKRILVPRPISMPCLFIQAVERDAEREEAFEQFLQHSFWCQLGPHPLHLEHALARLDPALVRKT